jgi:uncharacterized membrane protein YheB (UPF0754 family)
MTNFNIGEYCFNKTGKLVGCKKVILQKEKKDHKIAQKLYNDLKKTLGEKMERNKFNNLVINYFNEIKDKYLTDVKEEWDGEEIGSTILIEDYLLPFIYKNINDTKVMNRLSIMLEDLISLNDEYCEDVLYSSFFEKIHYDNMSDKFVQYYKEKTLDFFNKLKF